MNLQKIRPSKIPQMVQQGLLAPQTNENHFVADKKKGLHPSKALGPDELHPRVLKELATELGPVFAHLFQQSIDTGEIPKEWSLANICPLFKKSDRSLACNYRPVSFDLCTLQVTRTHSMFKYHGPSC